MTAGYGSGAARPTSAQNLKRCTVKTTIAQQLRKDWFFGLLLALLLLATHLGTGAINSLEMWFYDKALLSMRKTPSDQVLIAAIDDRSIEKIGRYPWSREVHAKLVDKLAAAGAATIVHTGLFLEPQENSGLAWIRRQLDLAEGQTVAEKQALLALVRKANGELDSDTVLANSIRKAGNVQLASLTQWATGGTGSAPPERNQNSEWFLTANPTYSVSAQRIQLPIPNVRDSAAGIGSLVGLPDRDGRTRRAPLFVSQQGGAMPSLALSSVAFSAGLNLRSLDSTGSTGIELGNVRIPTDRHSVTMPMQYASKRGMPAFDTVSVSDIISGQVADDHIRGRIVVIGATASGLATSASAMGSSDSILPNQVDLVAQEISSLLLGHSLFSPDWAWTFTALAYALAVIYVSMLLPRLAAKHAIVITSVSVMCIVAAVYGGMTSPLRMWIPMGLPIATLVIVHVALTSKRFVLAEAGKHRADDEASETNRMMGMSLQAKGELDAAFDRFRRVSRSEQLVSNLHTLAIDFERKRHFTKAQAVHELVLNMDQDNEKSTSEVLRLSALANSLFVGGTGSSQRSMVPSSEGLRLENPTLGRYELIGELGRGAMGVVYRGRDPKLGREVAIKTMALGMEFDGAELLDVKERFFREARTAGRLHHSNIVTIHDVGEDQDLAYIAMELLRGVPLDTTIQRQGGLPLARAVRIAIDISLALDHAHSEGVVHRDIKPANILFDAESEQLKITDFGIARIADSSRTKTGVVMGTPAYMAPEQIQGHTIDGRADLYALGVMLFEMIAGSVPFTGESMSDLVYKIVHVAAPSVSSYVVVPGALEEVLRKALEKDPKDRYQTGREFAEALARLDCLNSF
jgi:eukaryotic-like serine/threonine-protein kinase